MTLKELILSKTNGSLDDNDIKRIASQLKGLIVESIDICPSCTQELSGSYSYGTFTDLGITIEDYIKYAIAPIESEKMIIIAGKEIGVEHSFPGVWKHSLDNYRIVCIHDFIPSSQGNHKWCRKCGERQS